MSRKKREHYPTTPSRKGEFIIRQEAEGTSEECQVADEMRAKAASSNALVYCQIGKIRLVTQRGEVKGFFSRGF